MGAGSSHSQFGDGGVSAIAPEAAETAKKRIASQLRLNCVSRASASAPLPSIASELHSCSFGTPSRHPPPRFPRTLVSSRFVPLSEFTLTRHSYVLFSIGNLTPLFNIVWKDCWKSGKTCNIQWVNSVTYLEIVGIIFGQIFVGIIGDGIGRRWGLIQDATIMFIGLLMLTASWGTTLNGWVICYALSLLFYGFGVGGEYPMTATAAMENAVGSGKVSTREDRLHRGRKVTTAFLMQGWGQFFNQVILIILLLIFHSGGEPPYTVLSAQWTFRVSFAIPAVGTLWLVYYRFYKMPLASKQLNAAKAKANVTGYDVKSLGLTFYHFGPRIIATAGGWFCNDVFFYGNKLFQSQFISVISGPSASGNVMTGWLWNLVNVFVSLCGYYMACEFSP